MKTRRHHNNKGYRQVKNGKTLEHAERIAKSLWVNTKEPVLVEQTKQYRYFDAEGNFLKVVYWVRYPSYDFIFALPEKGSKRHDKEFGFFQYRKFAANGSVVGWSIYLDQCELEEMVDGFKLVVEASKGTRPKEWESYQRPKAELSEYGSQKSKS